jgi:hypothetical protein
MENAKALTSSVGTPPAAPERGACRPAMLERPGQGTHLAQVYRDDDFLAEAVATFVDAGVRAGDGIVALCSLQRWETVRARLAARGIDSGALAARQQLHRAGVHSILLDWMSNRCGQAAFNETAGARVELALKHGPAVRVFSELADVLLGKDDRALAVEVQHSWNNFLRGTPVAVLSAWRHESLDPVSARTRLESLYLIHDVVLS